jgi:hypothetical protein
MTDVSLFDALEEDERFARRSDPDPSKVAGKVAGDSFGPLTARVLATLLEVERTNAHRPGGTVAEIQMLMAYDGLRVPDRNSISRRLTSLLRKGFVRDTGERRDGGRGVDVTVYAATQEGRAWLT